MEMGTASCAEAEDARDCEVISGNSLQRLAGCNHRSAAAVGGRCSSSRSRLKHRRLDVKVGSSAT